MVVSFNGIQLRAKSSQLQASLDPYIKALKLYQAENGGFPDYPNVCIGKLAEYPATSQFPAGACVANASTNAADISVSTALNAALGAYITNPPTLNTSTVSTYAGYNYGGTYVDSGASWYEIQFALPGSQPCPSNFREYDLSGIHWCETSSTG